METETAMEAPNSSSSLFPVSPQTQISRYKKCLLDELPKLSSSKRKLEQDDEGENVEKENQKGGGAWYELLHSRRKKQPSSIERPLYDYALSSSRKPQVRNWASSSAAGSVKEYYFDSRCDPDNLAFGDIDIDALDNKLRSGGRYWSATYAAIEHHKNLKRLKFLTPPMMNIPADFVSLSVEVKSDEGIRGDVISGNAVVEESLEDDVFRKTKEFNKMTRERPHDEQIWLAFAQFQDKVAKLNPDSEDLLLSLMNAYQSRDSIDDLISRWEKILIQNSGSCTLWREFLRVVQGDFSRFKVFETRKMYANAIQALSGAWTRQHRQVSGSANSPSMDPAIIRLELGLADTYLNLCRFEWQAGYRELATPLFQAQIEYSLFCPSLLLSEQSKLRLFEHFWNSNGARAGEDGALGWSKWLEKGEELRQRSMKEESSHDSGKGGWTGWSDPLSKSKESNVTTENITENDGGLDELEDESEMKDGDQKDDTEALLKMLGIDATAEANCEIKDTRTWTRWYEYLFSISSEEARFSLVSQFIDFYGGRMTPWTCTNSSTWAGKSLSLETIPDSLFDELRRMHDQVFSNSDDISMKTSMMRFVRDATLLSVLIVEELSNTLMNTSRCSVTPCRTLAKSLLKHNRQDVLLCGVYAQREAVFGNIDHARKIFDKALSSIDGLPQLKAHQGLKEQVNMLCSSWTRGLIDDHSVALICSASLFEEITIGWTEGVQILEQAFTMRVCTNEITKLWFVIQITHKWALENEKLHNSVLIWRSYIAYESDIACNPSAARRAFFRAIHACPWSKRLWRDGFIKLNSVLTAKELSDLQEIMRDKELNLRTDTYEILLEDDVES
ncbi:unnamed protein product [Withania somnifera]